MSDRNNDNNIVDEEIFAANEGIPLDAFENPVAFEEIATDTSDKKSDGSGGVNSYRSILKGTSIFGGVQIFQILVTLLRGKFVAILLGPEGAGISNLYTSSGHTLHKIAGLGLPLALTKEISTTKENPQSLARTKAISRQLILITGILAALICLIGAPWLSRITFNDTDHTLGFRFLSLGVFFATASAGEAALLQGMHDVKRLSMATLVGSAAGLLFGVPLYYFFGFNGIVPAIILMTGSTWIFYRVSVNKAIITERVKFNWSEHKETVRKLLLLGIVLMASDSIGNLCTYLLNIFLRSRGGYDAVGLYNAANSITNQYAGMVFAAMALDYFPRLTAFANDNRAMREVVNRQSEIVSYIVTPLALLLLITAPLVIRILLTTQYLGITELMRWMAIGVMFKALSFPMGYIAFAKDNKRLFFILEGVMGNLLNFVCACGFYYFFGLIGLGYAIVVDNAICLMIYYFVNRHYYDYKFNSGVLTGYGTAILIVGATFALSFISNPWVGYPLMSVILGVSIAFSWINLKKRLKK